MFALEMLGITKTFGEGFKANDLVNFAVKKAEIHALVGENGAGKTTLMKILYGMYEPDKGRILIEGVEKSINSSSEAISLGIGMVHQHFMLVGPLTVLENIILGDELAKKFGLIDYNTASEKIMTLTKKFNINVDLKAKVETLPVGTQQKIEILKILYRNADILILDEPTAVLTPQESDELFVTLRELKLNGKTIILITHKLGEVLSVSDSVTILRHGKVTGSLETKSTNKQQLTNLIIGENLQAVSSKQNSPLQNVLLQVNEITVLNDKGMQTVNRVSFNINAGEILGIAGVEGNGQTELIEAISGLRDVDEGKILINGKILNEKLPVAHIPAKRHKHGIVAGYSLEENIILGRELEDIFSSPFLLKQKEISAYTDNLIDEYDIRPKNPKLEISAFSGGNQQKVVAARELSKHTDLIIASHPTRGLDIKAADFLRNALLEQTRKGKAILLVSSDLTELLNLCDRIAVMYNGEITAILDSKNTNERELGSYMTGMHKN